MVPQNSNSKRVVKAVIFGVVALLLLITLLSSMRSVDTGEVGVVTRYGKVTGRELGEGFSWVAPWGINNVTVYDVKTQKEQVDGIAAASKDLQDVKGTVVLNYELQRGEVSKIHQTVGKDYKDKLITPALNEVFKATTSQYTAQELITRRPEVKEEIVKQLTDRLKKYGITVQDVSLTNFEFSVAFNQAIESVQIANQKVAQAQQELAQAKIDAEKTVTQAQAQADAQRAQQQTLTSELLEKMWIEKWDGKLPTTTAGSNAQFYIPTK